MKSLHKGVPAVICEMHLRNKEVAIGPREFVGAHLGKDFVGIQFEDDLWFAR